MKKTYLITGGLGFIGKAVSSSLLNQGYYVLYLTIILGKKFF